MNQITRFLTYCITEFKLQLFSQPTAANVPGAVLLIDSCFGGFHPYYSYRRNHVCYVVGEKELLKKELVMVFP